MTNQQENKRPAKNDCKQSSGICFYPPCSLWCFIQRLTAGQELLLWYTDDRLLNGFTLLVRVDQYRLAFGNRKRG